MFMEKKLELEKLKELNEILNGFLDEIIEKWEAIEKKKLIELKNYAADINEAATKGLSAEELQMYLEDKEDIKNISLASYDIKEQSLSDIAREDLAQKVRDLKKQLKEIDIFKEDFVKENLRNAIKEDISNIKEVLNSHRIIYNKLHDVSEKIWNKAVLPVINAIKSPAIKVKEFTVETGSHLVAKASRYATTVKEVVNNISRKVGDFSKEAVNDARKYVKYLDAKCREVDKRDCKCDIKHYESKIERLEDKLDSLVGKKIGIEQKILEHMKKYAARKNATFSELKTNTPSIDEKIAKVQKEILEYQEKIALSNLELYKIEREQEEIVKDSKYEGNFISDDIDKKENLIKKQYADVRAQLENASNFDIAMAGVINVNDKIMHTAFAERIEINGEELPIYRVAIDGAKIKQDNLMYARTIANLSNDERIYPTNQGYNYLYTTDPERAVEWGQEFSKRGVLHEKGIECSSDKAAEVIENIAKSYKEIGVTIKQKNEMDR